MSDEVRIRFALDRDADGWPTAESEGLWAERIDGGGLRLDNTPWFLRGVAAGDVVEAEPDGDGVLWFQRVLEHRGRIVVRAIPRRDGPLLGDAQAVLDAFARFGVSGEGAASPATMVALDIGPHASLADVKALLMSGENDGRWYYEKGCVTADWRQIE